MQQLLFLFLLLIGATSPYTAAHASEQTGTVVQTITHTIRVPEGGTLEEGLALSNEWREKVLDKNPYIASVTYLGRAVSNREYKLMVLYEYASEDNVSKANAAFPGLMEAAWDDDAGVKVFLNKLWKYIDRAENTSHRYQTVTRSKN
ncbi:MAG: hypothetical protein COB37_01665 [Kordiimonadales bacterium]|nr:MAG: hypothetical protein COB37_01665 [Kordiimonadales bacterium]